MTFRPAFRRIPSAVLVCWSVAPVSFAQAPAEAPVQMDRQEEIARCREQLASKDAQQRATAANRLGHLGAVETAPELMTLLDDASPDVQYFALGALKEFDAEGLVPHARRLLASPYENVKVMAAIVLIEAGDKKSLPAVLALLESPSPFLHQTIAMSFGMSRTVEAVPALVKLVESPESGARYWALAALGAIGKKDSAEVVARFLDDPNPEIQLAAVTAVSQIDPARFKARLRAALESESERVRAAARTGLAGIQDPVAKELILEAGEYGLLNNYSAPETCAVLGETRIERRAIRREPLSEIVRLVSEKTGIEIQISESVPKEVLAARYGANASMLGPSPPALGVLNSFNMWFMDAPVDLAIIVEKDLVRLVTPEEAKAFWEE